MEPSVSVEFIDTLLERVAVRGRAACEPQMGEVKTVNSIYTEVTNEQVDSLMQKIKAAIYNGQNHVFVGDHEMPGARRQDLQEAGYCFSQQAHRPDDVCVQWTQQKGFYWWCVG